MFENAIFSVIGSDATSTLVHRDATTRASAPLAKYRHAHALKGRLSLLGRPSPPSAGDSSAARA